MAAALAPWGQGLEEPPEAGPQEHGTGSVGEVLNRSQPDAQAGKGVRPIVEEPRKDHQVVEDRREQQHQRHCGQQRQRYSGRPFPAGQDAQEEHAACCSEKP